MRNKILAVLTMLAFVANTLGYAVFQENKSNNNLNELASLLPKSDGVITVDMNRLLSEALPQILSAKPATLNKITGKIDEIKSEMGLDLRKFKSIAIGLKASKVTKEKMDLEPVALARGDLKAKSVISLARLLADGKYHTEKNGSRTIYIFSTEKIIENNKPEEKKDKSFLDKTFDSMFKGLSKEIAVTEYDENTVVFGTLERVKETIATSSKVDDKVLNLLSRKPNAVANMGAMLPTGLAPFIELGDDEIDDILRDIRQMQGSLDVGSKKAFISLLAKSSDESKAEDLETTLLGLQMVGSSFLGNSDKPKNQLYSRMIEDVKISRETDKVMLDLDIAQSDIDTLLGKK